ncbi:type II toxin-antitoxin system VapC family toxin [Patulibacter americanus]|uniref:type II toxin-antitoxin system VapC family toxin n=1 Tax=Patulibacter americanus TaxID=588672 RepID=UPI0003B5DE32|nr:type II toxin-antitoxin system VapC family toxin [Patulibacter americanus]
MTVFDTSVVVDLLLGSGAAPQATALLEAGPAAAPDVLTFEVVAVLRRLALRGDASEDRLAGAVADFGDLAIDHYPSLPLRSRAWSLRENATVADALFVALAESLGEPLATKDEGLATVAERFAGVEVVRLGAGRAR